MPRYATKPSYGPNPRYKRKYRRKNTSLAKKAYSLAKKAYKMPELKYKITTLTPANGNALNTGWIGALSTISQGVTNDTRIGDRIQPTSVKIRMQWTSFSPLVGTNFRIIVFRWASEAPVTGFNSATQILDTASIYSFKSEDLRYQSQILYDKLYLDAEVTSGRVNLPTEINIPLKKYIAFDGTTSSSNRNGIYLMVITDSGTTTLVGNLATARLYYKDP